MNTKTNAIVLNKIRYNDNSFVANLYSSDFGRFATLIRTSESQKNKIKISSFFPLNIIDIEVDMKKNKSMQTLTYCNNSRSLLFHQDVYKICIAQFIAEVILRTIKEEEKDRAMFDFFRSTALLLEQPRSHVAAVHLLFLRTYIRLLGFGITDNYCPEAPFFNLREGMFLHFYTNDHDSLDEQMSQLFHNFMLSQTCSDGLFKSLKTRKLILNIMLTYYQCHIPTFKGVKSLSVFDEIFHS